MDQNSSVTPIAPYAAGQQADDEIDLRELVATLIGGTWLLAFVMALCLVLGIGYAWVATRIYESDALVQVEDKNKGGLNAGLGDLAEVMDTMSEVTAEIELLKSRMVVGSVVDDLKLTIQVEPHYFPVFGKAVAGLGLDGAPTFLRARQYAWGAESITVSAFDVPSELLGKEFTLTATADGYELSLEGEVVLSGKVGARVESDPAAEQRIGLFVQELIAPPGVEFALRRISRIKAITKIQKELRVTEKGKDSGILQVAHSGADPILSREVVNRLVVAYQRQNIERRSAEAEQTLQFLQAQLPQIRQKLESAEAEFNSYRLKEGSADLTKETELILQQSVQLETSRIDLEQKRQEALQRFTPSHPMVQAIDRQLQSVADEQNLIGKRVQNLPETQQVLLRLSREVEVNTTLYTALLNNFQELQVVKAGTVGNVRIIDYAVEASEPSKPKVRLIQALSLVLGAFLGIALVFVRRALRQAVNDPADVERALGIPTYATIPYTPSQAKMFKRGQAVEGGLLAFIEPQNIAVEALRSLRTSLHFAMLDASTNVLMITGPAPDLGKSFVTINLGAVLAMTGKRVVVIDGDMRRGHLHRYVNCQRKPGLSNFCAGEVTVKDVVHRTVVDGLFFVPAGQIPPNPAELLLTDRFAELIGALSRSFDYVLIDTPPVLAGNR